LEDKLTRLQTIDITTTVYSPFIGIAHVWLFKKLKMLDVLVIVGWYVGANCAVRLLIEIQFFQGVFSCHL
jgi:hypothetical protein